MLLDIKKALIVPFSDENWQRKIGIAALLYIPAFVASLQFNEKSTITGCFYALASFIITGYALLAANNEINNEQIILPEWNFLNCITSSFKLWLINLGWLLILMPFIFLLFFISAFHSSLLIISIMLGIPLIMMYVLVLNISQSLFLKRLEFQDAFGFQDIFEIIKKYSGKYIFYIIVFLGLAIIYGIIAKVIASTFSFLINTSFGYYVAYLINVFFILSAFNLLAQVMGIVNKEQNSFLDIQEN